MSGFIFNTVVTVFVFKLAVCKLVKSQKAPKLKNSTHGAVKDLRNVKFLLKLFFYDFSKIIFIINFLNIYFFRTLIEYVIFGCFDKRYTMSSVKYIWTKYYVQTSRVIFYSKQYNAKEMV